MAPQHGETGVTKSSLDAGRHRLLEIIEELGFSRIEQLEIQSGAPRYDPAPRILQEIRLGSEPEHRSDPTSADLTLKKEVARLFDQLNQLHDGFVDIEVRHSIPFRLVLKRRHTDFAVPPADKPC